MSWERGRRPPATEYGTEAGGETGWPGKRTLTESLGARRAVVKDFPAPDPAATFDRAMSGGGGDLPDRAEHETALGADFGGVRASFGRTAELAPIDAAAATYGDRIAFADAQPSRDVVAHELAHVVQFRNSGVGGGSPRALSSPDDPAERAARRGDASGGAPDALHLSPGKLKKAHKDLEPGMIVEIVGKGSGSRVKIRWIDEKNDEQLDEIDAASIEDLIPPEVASKLASFKDQFEFMAYLRDKDDVAERLAQVDDAMDKDLARLRRATTSYADLDMAAEASKQSMPKLMPQPISAKKELAKGTMSWDFKAKSANAAVIVIDFAPKDSVQAKAIGFIQTVVQRVNGKLSYDLRENFRPGHVTNEFQSFAEQGGSYVDPYDHESRSSPFYGADWIQDGWSTHDKGKVGKTGQAAKLEDRPATPHARVLDEPYEVTFESAAVVLETMETLGVLEWGYRIAGREKPLELLGAQEQHCTGKTSKQLEAAVAKHYATKFTMCDAFVENDDKLTASHKEKLTSLAEKLVQTPEETVVAGGAADLGEKDAPGLSLRRAQAVQAFLLEKQVPQKQIKIEAYGDGWALVPTDGKSSKPENRRVQIRSYGEGNLPRQHLPKRPQAPSEDEGAKNPKQGRKGTIIVTSTKGGNIFCSVVEDGGGSDDSMAGPNEPCSFNLAIPDDVDQVKVNVTIGDVDDTHDWDLSAKLAVKGTGYTLTATL